MKKMIAIHASPRKMWNTGTLVREAAKGAQLEGAQVNVIDLYRLDSFSGLFPALAASCLDRKENVSIRMA